MFVLVKEPVCRWPVRWSVVEADGAVVEKEIALRFVKVGQEEFTTLFNVEVAEVDAKANNRRYFNRLVRGWEDVVDQDKAAVPFDDEHIELLLDYPGFAEAFGRAYVSFWLARPEERRKNSEPSPDGGPATAAAQTAEAPASATD